MLNNDVVGKKFAQRTYDYTWRDVILYALGVGAKADELDYLWEKNLNVIPTFGVVPVFGIVGVNPPMDKPSGVAMTLPLNDVMAGLHAEHELTIHKRISPQGGRLKFDDIVTSVYDRGEGKGAVVITEEPVYDEEGDLVFRNKMSTIFRNDGGFGGESPPKNPIDIPERSPDYTADDMIWEAQHLLYRLSGDTNLTHVDPDFARSIGLERPIMHGLCSFGFACRLGIKLLIPGQPERLTRIAAQMRNPLFPGTKVRMQVWKISEKVAYFRFYDLQYNRAILDRGILEWS